MQTRILSMVADSAYFIVRIRGVWTSSVCLKSFDLSVMTENWNLIFPGKIKF